MNMRIRRTKAHAFIAIIALVALPAFAHPGSGICVMDNGQVFFVDTGYGIWKIDESGDVSSYAQADGHFLPNLEGPTFGPGGHPGFQLWMLLTVSRGR